jgi:hypothetical protein
LYWWLLLRRGLPKEQKQGVDTAVMLVSWRIWKERNARVFNNVELSANQLTHAVLSEGDQWIQAGARKLCGH